MITNKMGEFEHILPGDSINELLTVVNNLKKSKHILDVKILNQIMDNKITVGHIATELKDGKLEHVSIPLNMYKTLDELREYAKSEIDRYFDFLIEKSVGHDVTHAIYVHPLIHLVFNDLNKDNENWQNIINAEKN
jgi:hypothetical protein